MKDKFQTFIMDPVVPSSKKSTKCNECGIRFGLKSDLAKHVRNRPCAIALACPYCNISYLQQDALEKHIRVHHLPESIYKCKVCKISFTTNTDLKNHTSLHASKDLVTSEESENEFSDSDNLQQHAFMHGQDRPYPCVNCGETFVTKDESAKHGLLCCGKNFACHKCGNTFVNLDDLKKHVLNHKPVEKEFKFDSYNSSDTSAKFRDREPVNAVEKSHEGLDNTAIGKDDEKQDHLICITDTTCSNAGDDGAAFSGSTSSDPNFSDTPHLATDSVDVDELAKQACSDLPTNVLHNCELCGVTFPTQNMLHEHMLVHTSIESHKCLHCEAVFRSKDQYEEHLRIHFSESAYACLECRVNFTNVNNLNDHLRSHHSVEKLQTNVMNEPVIAAANAFRKQPIVPPPLKAHKCEECTASFNSKRELWEHISVHSDSDMTYTCQECGVAFASLQSLTTHIRSNHATKDYSNYGFANRNLVYERQLCHSGVLMPYQCVHCGSEFLSDSELIDHIRIHSSGTTYACQDCSLVFADAAGLNKHVVSRHPSNKLHNKGGGDKFRTGNSGNSDALHNINALRPFKCEVCGSDFSRKTHLIRHALIHTGEKPYKCEQCGTAFGRKSHLQRHAFIHTGEKPFICDHCGMAFGRRSHLKRHSIRQHGEPPSLPSMSPSSPMPTEQVARSSHAVAFPGMQPRTVKSSPSPPPFQPAVQVKQEVEHNMFPTPQQQFPAEFKSSPDPSQLPQSHPYWNLFQPMLRYNLNEALNWSRQTDSHSAYPNLKQHQKPIA